MNFQSGVVLPLITLVQFVFLSSLAFLENFLMVHWNCWLLNLT